MQTKSVSLHFMVFLKGPRKWSEGKKKEGEEEEEKNRDRGRKKPHKIFTAELRKFAKVMKNSQRTHITNPCSFPLINLIHSCVS